ncbi:MAG: Jag N-terminal domain-containing protein [Clostridia bacterium]|nr:Jag N-terminal domain-containing protein [Clostridia bacterium]
MLSIEATGKNIEQAIENALFELKAIREDVDIKILEEGGFFKKAKVLVSISEDAVEKYQSREKKRQEIVAEVKTEETVAEQAQQQEEEPKKEEEVVAEQDDHDEEIEVLVSENAQPTSATDVEKTQYFINGIIQKAKLAGNVEVYESDDEVLAKITGASELIGYRGEGLNALQYLTSVMVSKNNRHSKRVKVDCDNYRARREDTLIALAHRMERKVEKSHSSVKLEPMTANERRIIHTALSNSKTVQTESKGTEPHRFLVISPKQN